MNKHERSTWMRRDYFTDTIFQFFRRVKTIYIKKHIKTLAIRRHYYMYNYAQSLGHQEYTMLLHNFPRKAVT